MHPGVKTIKRDLAERSTLGSFAPVSVQNEWLGVVGHHETRVLCKASVQLFKCVLAFWTPRERGELLDGLDEWQARKRGGCANEHEPECCPRQDLTPDAAIV